MKKAFSVTTAPSQMKPLGILGGGQLARMMILRAHQMGLPVAVLAAQADEPAAQVTSHAAQGSLDSSLILEDFLRRCSVVTFESEFLDAALLEKLSEKTGTPIYPRPQQMHVIQDRLTQKELLREHGLPTAKFLPVSTAADAQRAFGELKSQVVFKKRRFGYDGYGTFVVRSERELKAFLPEIDKNPQGFIAESFIPFRRELAVMGVRGLSGETRLFPFVETFQENSRCLWVKGPLKISSALSQLGKRITRFLQKIDYVGAMGFELFDGRSGLLINELAPRVHNSGHYSLDALHEDQFTAHLKAVTGLKLAKPSLLNKGGFAMLNLIGTSDQPPRWELPTDVRLHWYGKRDNRPGRKMGHLNATGPSAEKALKLLIQRRKDFQV